MPEAITIGSGDPGLLTASLLKDTGDAVVTIGESGKLDERAVTVSTSQDEVDATPSCTRRCCECMHQTAYKGFVVAPRLIGPGLGWTLGCVYGGHLGAKAGAALGAFLGALGALGIELVIGKQCGFNPELEAQAKTTIAVDRCKSALVLAAGCLLAGAFLNVFGTTIPEYMDELNPYVSFFTTYVGSALSYTVGATAIRCLTMYPCDPEARKDWKKNLKEDAQTGACSVGATEGMFAALRPPLVRHGAYLFGKHTQAVLWQSGRAVIAGSLIGTLLKKVGEQLRSCKTTPAAPITV